MFLFAMREDKKTEEFIEKNAVLFRIPKDYGRGSIANKTTFENDFRREFSDATPREIEDAYLTIVFLSKKNITNKYLIIYSLETTNCRIGKVSDVDTVMNNSVTTYKITVEWSSKKIVRSDIPSVIEAQFTGNRISEILEVNSKEIAIELFKNGNSINSIDRFLFCGRKNIEMELRNSIIEKFSTKESISIIVKSIMRTKNIKLFNLNKGACNSIELTQTDEFRKPKESRVLIIEREEDSPEEDIKISIEEIITSGGDVFTTIIPVKISSTTLETALSDKKNKFSIWPIEDVVDELFAIYENLDEETKSQIPLKRIWMLADTK